MTRALFLAICTSASWAHAADAVNYGAAGAPAVKSGSAAGEPTAVSRAAELIGAPVVNRRGEELAELKELILDLRTGRVHAAVLEFGGDRKSVV